MNFVEEFRKNIPYIADGMGEWVIEGLQEVQLPFIYKSPKEWEEGIKKIYTIINAKVEEALIDWLNEYQTEEARNKDKNYDY